MDIRTIRLRKLLDESPLSQTDICEKTGINKGAMSSYLTGRYFPKQKALEQLSKVFNVSIPYLMGLEDEPKINTIAAHHDDEEWTKEELDEIEMFKNYVKSKRDKAK